MHAKVVVVGSLNMDLVARAQRPGKGKAAAIDCAVPAFSVARSCRTLAAVVRPL